jgi:hypothetical protein
VVQADRSVSTLAHVDPHGSIADGAGQDPDAPIVLVKTTQELRSAYGHYPLERRDHPHPTPASLDSEQVLELRDDRDI